MGPELTSLALDEKRALLLDFLKQRASRPRREPLSKGQERIWRLLDLEPESAVYNLGFAYELKGPLDVGALEGALRTLTHRHEAMRTAFEVVDGAPMRVIVPEVEVRFERVDLSWTSEADFPAEARRLASEIARARIDLTRPPLWRFTLLERAETDRVFLINTHHITADRWSVGVLVQELVGEYSARVRGQPSPLTTPAGSYSEAIRQLEHPEPALDEELAAQLAYWRGQFAPGVQDLLLPTDIQPAGEGSYRGMRRAFTLSPTLAAKLTELAAGEGTTIYVVLLAALSARLHLDTGQTELVLITPVSGRHHAAARGVIGYFNNLLPIRLSLVEGAGFRELIQAAIPVVKGAFEHQDVPFQQIAELPGLDRIHVARCFVSVQNTTPMDLDLPGITSSYYDVPTDTSNFDLAVFVEEQAGTYRGLVDARTDHWSSAALDQFIERFLALLPVVADQPDRPLAQLREEPGVGPPALRIAGTPPQTPGMLPTPSASPARLRNELERRMIGIWEDVLGVRPLGPESHFFELGGHSLMAARLFDRIGRTIGREIPLAALVRAPTVRQLGELILQGGDAPCWAALVPLQPNGTRPPFFCVHGGGGGVLSFTRIAEHLGPDQPLWGLQASRREGQGPPQSVESMAGEYIQAMRTVRPEGPYYLCGHSFGGLVAYEMARQLTEQGQTVALMVVIDFPGPDARITWLDKLRWYLYSLAQLEFRQKIPYILGRVRWKIQKHPRMSRALALLGARLLGNTSAPSKTEYRLKTMGETMTALELYRPGPYPGRLTLFRARGGDPAINTDPHGGWDPTARGGVEVHDFTCDHMDMLNEPHCAHLSAALRDCLDRAIHQFEGDEAAAAPAPPEVPTPAPA